jgi:hypothetical protein
MNSGTLLVVLVLGLVVYSLYNAFMRNRSN